MYKKLLLSFLFILVAGTLLAQTVEVSKKRTTINGKTYFVHKVKKGQTLYSISKAYGVEVNDIVFENPGLLDGIQKGQILHIPVKTHDARHQKKHIVKKGETIYSICKQYNITESALYQANITLRKNGLKAGETIFIPLKDFSDSHHKFSMPTVADKSKTTTIQHKVLPKETLYSLTRQFGISTEDLYNANPNLKTTGLKAGTIINIPTTAHSQTSQTTQTDTATPVDSSMLSLLNTAFSNCDTAHYKQKDIRFLVAIPFVDNDFEKMKEVEVDFADFKNLKSYPYLEFYEGILLTVDSLKKEGINCNLTVVNSNDTSTLKQAVQKAPDIFIGPISPLAYKAIKPYSSIPKIWIEPFKPNQQIHTDNYYAVLPNKQTYVTHLTHYVKQQDSATCIVVSSPLYRDTALVNRTYRDWYHFSLTSQKDFIVKKLSNSHKPLKEVENALSVGRKNFVVFFTENEPEVAEFISKLRLSTEDYDIHILILPSWKQFDLNTEYLHRLQALRANPYFIEYQNTAIRNFVKTYDRYFHTMPSRFTFWGFDISYYFANAVAHFGTEDFKHCSPMYKPSLLETQFHFSGTNGHLQNDHLFILHYTKDFKIIVTP